MSYKAFNVKKNKAKKGISPVIATVILVAVAVVIAAALAGFSSSLFGTYSSAGAAVTVGALEVNNESEGTVVLQNSGNTSDQVVSIQAGTASPHVFEAPVMIAADGVPVSIDFDTGEFTAGQIITVKISLSSGLQLTQSTIVTQA